jgi:hypothetical protein
VRFCKEYAALHKQAARDGRQPAIDEYGADRWGRRAAHGRWHVKRGVYKHGCEFCREAAKSQPPRH